jgi:hypothetical protein
MHKTLTGATTTATAIFLVFSKANIELSFPVHKARRTPFFVVLGSADRPGLATVAGPGRNADRTAAGNKRTNQDTGTE